MVLHNHLSLSVATEGLTCRNNDHGLQLLTFAYHAVGPAFEPRPPRAIFLHPPSLPYLFSHLPHTLGSVRVIVWHCFMSQPDYQKGHNIIIPDSRFWCCIELVRANYCDDKRCLCEQCPTPKFCGTVSLFDEVASMQSKSYCDNFTPFLLFSQKQLCQLGILIRHFCRYT